MWTLDDIRIGLSDPKRRWEAAAAAGEYVYDAPDDVWPIVVEYGSAKDEDTRQAIATNILEHLLEHHFDRFFPLVEEEVQAGNDRLADTLRLSWKLGLSTESGNSQRWDSLLSQTERDAD